MILGLSGLFLGQIHGETSDIFTRKIAFHFYVFRQKRTIIVHNRADRQQWRGCCRSRQDFFGRVLASDRSNIIVTCMALCIRASLWQVRYWISGRPSKSEVGDATCLS
jgi:hypothetical protein